MATQKALIPEVVSDREIQDKTHEEEFRALEHLLQELPWWPLYQALLSKGYGWRKTAFLAWSATPKEYRDGTTLKDFAKQIEVSAGTVYEWNNDPILQGELFLIRQRLLASHDQAVLDALVDSASNPSYKHAPDRKVYLEIRGIYNRNLNLTMTPPKPPEDGDLSDFSPDELAQLRQVEAAKLEEGAE